MRLGTSTNIVYIRPNGTRLPLEDTLRLGSEAGFKELDFNSYDWSLEGAKLLDDDWEAWIHSVAEKAEAYGVKLSQAHAYSYDFLRPNLTTEQIVMHERLVDRSLKCAYILGSKVVVTHLSTQLDTPRPREASKAANHEYFKKYLERTRKFNYDISIENQWDVDIAPKRKYGTSAEELVEFITLLNEPRIGICWDFEHGDLMQADQPQEIRYIGKLLKATHVSDHYGWKHPHIMPLFGQINWKPIMKALRDINYQGVFSFEAHNYTNKLPDEVLGTALRLSYEIGSYLVGLATSEE
ncbi:sugar phosphate isomerase/epimerase family protein [Paenibacillus crassostreae]|uniref:Xylose isomerase-like TIM barrel domain-containing protein n=1 Tax=Paenibacillus crassostreae TaxID=1763538 RepID=A0A167BF08_9BACL|nr:sugar phosphate isomerase/epimerase [Paenibacillus crassostreae]AOZ92897.1 hypothetical protein LPB68_12180 [Paenibacillus crassostreae]OAB72014.1 hypothetical protein PNBC_18715 [Paenibacillus crassostreae]